MECMDSIRDGLVKLISLSLPHLPPLDFLDKRMELSELEGRGNIRVRIHSLPSQIRENEVS